MTFQDVFLIQKELASLQSLPRVRELLGMVAQDAQNETIDLVKSRESVVFQMSHIPTKEAMYAIRAFLQNLVYWMLSAEGTELFNTFLYENHTRIQKLLVVAKLLDHANLQSFGSTDNPVKPMPSDIPTYARLWAVVLDFQVQHLSEFHEANLAYLKVMDPAYLHLCPEDDAEDFENRCAEELAN